MQKTHYLGHSLVFGILMAVTLYLGYDLVLAAEKPFS